MSVDALIPRMTPAQQRVYDALCAVVGETGWPASLRDIQRRTDLASMSTVTLHLHTLAAKGLAQHRPGQPGWLPTERWLPNDDDGGA